MRGMRVKEFKKKTALCLPKIQQAG